MSEAHVPHRNARAQTPVLPVESQTLNDLGRGRLDIEFFARRWLGIEGNPGQERWWKACAERDESGWRPRYLTTVVSAGNRAGKTLAMAVLVLHHTFYKLGIESPKAGDRSAYEAWLRAPYEWYHVGVQQEVAGLVHTDCQRILRGEHLAQRGRGCPLIKELGPVATSEKKYLGEYQMVEFHPVVGGGHIIFRSTEDKAKALLGKDMNGVSFDEAGRELYLLLVYHEVLHFRRLSTGGPLHFIGTPITDYPEYGDLWEQGNPDNPDRDPRVISLRMSTRENIGYGIDAAMFEELLRQVPEYLIPQNIDGFFIEAVAAYFRAASVEQCFTDHEYDCPNCEGSGVVPVKADVQFLDSSLIVGLLDTCPVCNHRGKLDGLPEESAPAPRHYYIQGVDLAIASDATWCITLDYTARKAIKGVRVRRSIDRQTIQGVANMVHEGHLLYSSGNSACQTVIDSSGMGGKMFRQEFSGIRPLLDFDFGGKAAQKAELLADLRAVLDKKQVALPRSGRFWGELRRQLLGYRLDDKKLTTDAVMALALAVRYAIRNPTTPSDRKFEFF